MSERAIVFLCEWTERERKYADRCFLSRRYIDSITTKNFVNEWVISKSHRKSGHTPCPVTLNSVQGYFQFAPESRQKSLLPGTERRSSKSMKTRNSALEKWIRRRKFNIITLGEKSISLLFLSSLHRHMWKVIESGRPSEYFIPSPADDHNKNFLFSFDQREGRGEREKNWMKTFLALSLSRSWCFVLHL